MSRPRKKQLKKSVPSSNKSKLYIKETRYEPGKSTDSIEKTKRKSALEVKRRQEENKIHSKWLDV